MRRILILWVLGGAAAAAVVASSAFGGDNGRTKSAKTTINLVAYSTPKDAFGQIIAAFQNTAPGKDTSFTQSYGSSGEQSRAVLAGLPADLVDFSLAPDLFPLIKKGLVSSKWNKDKFNGMVTHSVVVFVVRDGNPKHIRSWNDLVKPGVEVITPNPFTSGGARWNVMAAYGALRKNGRTDKQSIGYLNALFHHVPVQDKSAREALQTFAGGKGDVLITYENEAIYANKKGVKTDYVLPRQTILIENPIALTKSGQGKAAAQSFYRFLRRPLAQKIFAEQGYRPVLKSVAAKYKFPQPRGLFTIRDLGLGGWAKVQKRFFDPRTGVMAKIEASLGIGTGG